MSGPAGPRDTRDFGLRHVARDSGLTLVRQGISSLVVVASTVVVARTLGAAGQGAYTLALLLPNLAVVLTSLGLAPATAYFVGRGDHSVAEALRGNLALIARIAPVGYLLIAAALALRRVLPADPFAGVPDHLILLGSAMLLITLIQSSLLAILQGLQRFGAYNLGTIAPQAVALLFLFITLVVLRLDISAALASTVAGQLLGLTVTLAAVLRMVEPGEPVLRWRLDTNYTGRMSSYGIRAHASTVVTFAMYRLDVVLLGLLLSATVPVGLYAVAYQWAQRLGFLSQALSVVMLPRIAELSFAEETRRRLTPRVARAALWLSIPAAAAVAAAAPWVIPALYGDAFRGSVLPLQVMLPGVVLWNVSRTLSSDLAGRGRPGVPSAIDAAGLLVNVALNLAWIPSMGIVGAALATTVSLAISTVAKTFVYSRIARVHWRRVWIPEHEDVAWLVRRWGSRHSPSG